MIPQFKSILDLLTAFPDEQTCINHLENLRWNGNPVSPFDPTSKVYKCAGNKYKCKNTGKYFNVRTATIFDNTKVPLQKWFLALYVFSSHKKGISSHQLARDITVTQKTAWFLLHRLRYAFEHPNFQAMLSNEVEIDETFVGGKNKNRHADKKVENSQGRSYKDKTPVLGMIERDGNLITKVVPDTKQDTVEPIINTHVKKGANVYTDEWHAYNNLGENYNHQRVNHGAKEYVNFMASTNSIENFWSHLKRGIDGIYHWVSRDHLQSYVDEYTLRFNTRKFGTQERFDLVLSSVAGKRLTYNELTK
jgi:transposase-like protein